MQIKHGLMITIAATVVFILTGCTNQNSEKPASSETETSMNSVSVEQTESVMSRLCGLWLADSEQSEKMRLVGFKRIIVYFDEDGTGKAYIETPEQNYLSTFIIETISGNDIMIRSVDDSVNNLSMTVDSNGEDVLMFEDGLWEGEGNNKKYFPIPMSRTDETILEGKTYIEVTKHIDIS